uniref:Uncharacterized protein n=1 Tax=Micrurus corallinus TaxID=54390 RepID=A0A2D4F5K1_MICCO
MILIYVVSRPESFGIGRHTNVLNKNKINKIKKHDWIGEGFIFTLLLKAVIMNIEHRIIVAGVELLLLWKQDFGLHQSCIPAPFFHAVSKSHIYRELLPLDNKKISLFS